MHMLAGILLTVLAAHAAPDVSACTKRGSDITYCLSLTSDESQIAKIHSIAMQRLKAKQRFDEASPPLFVEAQSAGRLAAKTSAGPLLDYAKQRERRTRFFGVASLSFLIGLLQHGLVNGEAPDHQRLAEVWPVVRPVCTGALKDPEAATQRLAAECLGGSKEAAVAPTLVQFITTTSNAFLRGEALDQLRALPVDAANKDSMKELVGLIEKKADDRSFNDSARDICKILASYKDPNETWGEPAATAFPKECAALHGSGGPAGEVE